LVGGIVAPGDPNGANEFADAMTEPMPFPSDRQLVAATREGSDEAWGELVERHRPALDALARELRPRDPNAAVEAALASLRRDLIETDPASDEASLGFAVRALRPRSIALLSGGTYSPVARSSDSARAPGVDDIDDVDDASMPAGATAASLTAIAVAFGRLSEPWQTVLWHHVVDGEPAASMTAALGRSPADVVALEAAAERGLFEAFAAVELETPGSVESACRPIVPLLAAHQRGTLSDPERRRVDAHLGSEASTDGPADGEAGCSACRGRLDVMSDLDAIVPLALVPGLTGSSVGEYRRIMGIAAAFGAAALVAQRSERANRRARVGAALIVIFALLGAALLIRNPFGDVDGRIADLIDPTSSTTVPPGGPSTTTPGSTEPLPSRIEILFPGVPQGITYVPGGPSADLSLSLSSPAPVYRGGTGTVDAGLTNESATPLTVDFVIRSSEGVSFDEVAEGAATCEPDGDAALCKVSLAAGATAEMALRFAFDVAVPDRVVVASSIRSRVLQLPVVSVPGLVLGLVGRGDLVVVGNMLTKSSSADLELSAGADVDEAVLVWQGAEPAPATAGEIGLVVPGDPVIHPVTPDGRAAPGSEQQVGFRSTADVTDLVRSAGPGRYTVVDMSANSTESEGVWTLLVVTRQDTSVRRLVVVVDPLRPAPATSPVVVDVPIESAAPPGPPRSPVRPTTVTVHSPFAEPGAGADVSVAVNGEVVIATPDGIGVTTYALDIDATEDALAVAVSTTTRPYRIAVIGLAVDIVT
jgi:hypothetical protein